MPQLTDTPVLGERFKDAFCFVAEVHSHQVRKGSEVPYIGHLLGVASIVIDAGGNENQAMAALLHDTVEDHPVTLDEVRDRFGDAVADIVEACTDATGERKPPWRPRKETYIEHLPTAPDDALLVSLADKLHNARAILADYREVGPAVWQRFKAGPDDQLWYYRALALAFASLGDKVPSGLVAELDRVVREIEMMHEQEVARR